MNNNLAVISNQLPVVTATPVALPELGNVSLNAIKVHKLVSQLTGNFESMDMLQLNQQMVKIYYMLSTIRLKELKSGKVEEIFFDNGESFTKSDICMFAIDIILTHIGCVDYAMYKWQLSEMRKEVLNLSAEKRLGLRNAYKEKATTLYAESLKEHPAPYQAIANGSDGQIISVDQALLADVALQSFDRNKSLYFEEYSHLTVLIKMTQVNSRFKEFLKLSYEESDEDNRFIQNINENQEFLQKAAEGNVVEYGVGEEENWSEKGLFIVKEIINELKPILEHHGQTITFNPDKIRKETRKKMRLSANPIYFFLETEGLMRKVCEEALAENSEVCSLTSKEVDLHKFFAIQHAYSYARSNLRDKKLLKEARTSSHPPWGHHEGRINAAEIGLTKEDLDEFLCTGGLIPIC